MSGDRIINMGGGTYNESVHGDSINIQGNYINTSQDLSQAAAQIHQLLTQLEKQGYSSSEARSKVASDLATQAKSKVSSENRLITMGQYLSDAAASGLIGEAVVEVVKTALRLAGLPLP